MKRKIRDLILFIMAFPLFISADKYEASPFTSKRDEIKKPSPHVLKDSSAQVFASLSHFETSQHYDDKGNKKALEGAESYNKDDIELGGAYGLFNRLEIGPKLRYRLIDSKTSSGKKESNYGTESLLLGGKFFLGKLKEWEFAFSSSYRIPLYKTQYERSVYYETNSLALGDAQREWFSSLNFGAYVFSDFYFSTDIEFRQYSSLSDELAFRFSALFYNFDEYHLGFDFGAEYVSSMGNGSDQTLARAQTRTGSTYLFHSYNRSYYEPFIECQYVLGESSRIEVAWAKRMGGISTDGGTTLFASLTLTFDPPQERIVDKNQKGNEKGKIISGKVVKYSSTKRLLKVNEGVKMGFSPGMKVDIFEEDLTLERKYLGIGKVLEVEPFYSIIEVQKIFQGDIYQESLKNIKVEGYYW